MIPCPKPYCRGTVTVNMHPGRPAPKFDGSEAHCDRGCHLSFYEQGEILIQVEREWYENGADRADA